ncbi:hypothetical protein E4U61_001230 [Claviceps capensis]|nr:hypothetical protein E4U61_001230 [Claviceps capensis]
MSLDKYPFSVILLPTDACDQTSPCGPSNVTQWHVTQSQISPDAGHNAPRQSQSAQRQMDWGNVTQWHVTQSQISPDAGHNAPRQSQSAQRQMDWGNPNDRIQGASASGNNLLDTDQITPTPLAELPTTTNLRDRAPFEAAAEEHRSEVLGVILKEHKSKATKEAQERRYRNAQASKRSRDNRRIEERAAALKVKEMKQELDEIKLELQQNKERIQQTEEYARQTEEYARQERERSRQERERSRQKDAEIERLRRENEELKQRK